MIGIVDYGMGNVQSMLNAVEYIGRDALVTEDPGKLDSCSHIILPGVGAFGDAMGNLKKRDLVAVLQKLVMEKKKPFLGVCLGMQLLGKSSEEHGSHKGLGWIDAEIKAFKKVPGIKVPHVGWNDIKIRTSHPVFADLKQEHLTFYFVHSFHMVCQNKEDIAATCDYSGDFTAAIIKDNIVGTQFHPEKSQDNGLQLLGNFLKWGDTIVG
jgi:imidazole glycerol-phosphate synthase subunit HisH